MIWLLALPVWVVLWSFLLNKNQKISISQKTYIIICSLALIFVMGLRSRYVGTMDTFIYSQMFDTAQNFSDLRDFLKNREVLGGALLLSEGGFYTYVWLVAQVFSDVQWFILITSAFIVIATARFIYKNSDDSLISWISFVCLGSMTFTMNGMRQAMAMSFCLLSYRFVREKKLLRFLLIMIIAVLFHKSAIIFVFVYLMRNMKLNVQSFAFVAIGVGAFLIFAQNIAFIYDSFTGEDYATAETFESGGVVTILIYLIAIIGMLLRYKSIQDSEKFLPLALIIVGLSLYLGRFISTQIYERASYYFAYFLMLCFPTVLKESDPKVRFWLRSSFVLLSVVLFAYRIQNTGFAEYEMFW